MKGSIDHIAVRTSNIPDSVEFYKSVFGPATVNIAGEDSPVGRVDLVRIGSGASIELFEASRGQAGRDVGPVGLMHLAIAVDDVDAAYKRAIAAGGVSMRAPADTVLPAHAGAVIRAAFVFGPDGELFELITKGWTDRLYTR